MSQDYNGKKNENNNDIKESNPSSYKPSGAWGVALKVWDIAYPILMYYVAVVIVMMLLQTFIGTDNETYMLRQLIASLVAIPVVYTHYHYDRNLESRPTLKEFLAGKKGTESRESDMQCDLGQKSGQRNKLQNKNCDESIKQAGSNSRAGAPALAIWVIAVSALLGISLNNIISMTPLVTISSGYQEANEHFYGGNVIFEVLSSGITIPILEELLYRGVVYQRLKCDMPVMAAAVLSALLFGALHFNMVQFIYAFCIGLALALMMERVGHMAAAVAGHMTANFIAILRTETGWLAWSADGSAAAWVVSVVMLAVGIGLLLYLMRDLLPHSAKI